MIRTKGEGEVKEIGHEDCCSESEGDRTAVKRCSGVNDSECKCTADQDECRVLRGVI